MFGELKPDRELSGRLGSGLPGGVSTEASPRLPLPLSPGTLVTSGAHTDVDTLLWE